MGNDISQPRGKIGIVRLNRHRKAGVAKRIFMRAVNRGIVAQSLQLAHIIIHLRCGAFEQSATSHREQGIANKGGMLGGEMISDMSSGVGGHVDHRCVQVAQLHDIPAAHMPI